MKQKRSGGIGLSINGASLSADAKRVVGVLDKHLARAIELGRTEVATDIVKQLGGALGVTGTVVTNCTFTGIQ